MSYTSDSIVYPCDRCGVSLPHSKHSEHKLQHAQVGFAPKGTPVKRTYYETASNDNSGIGFSRSYSGKHRGK